MKFIATLLFLFTLSARAQEFPKQFTGNWKGELLWYQVGKKEPQKVAMELHIHPADTINQYTWQLAYGKPGEDMRPYILKPVDTAKGHWVIDERNGIVLDQYWIGGKFCSAFTVKTSTITDCYWIEGGKMHIEFITTAAKPINTTGGSTKDIPPVDSYAVKSYQKAILTRVKKVGSIPLQKSKHK